MGRAIWRQHDRRGAATMIPWPPGWRASIARAWPRGHAAHHGGGLARDAVYGAAAQRRIREEAIRERAGCGRARDGTAMVPRAWCDALCAGPKAGWSGRCLHDLADLVPRLAGLSWQQSRTWCATGMAVRQRDSGAVPSSSQIPMRRGKNPDRAGVHPRHRSRSDGVVRGRGRAFPRRGGPGPAVVQVPQGQPACQPHEYVRAGTTKILTLFSPPPARCVSNRRRASPMSGVARWAQDARRDSGGAARSRGAAHPGGQPCPVVRAWQEAS